MCTITVLEGFCQWLLYCMYGVYTFVLMYGIIKTLEDIKAQNNKMRLELLKYFQAIYKQI